MILTRKGRINLSSTKHNIVIDGNSLVFGIGASGTNLSQILSGLPLFSGSGITVQHSGTGGHAWSDMLTGIADIHSRFQVGKRNILFTWETTNSICSSNKTVAAALADAKAYADAVKATNPSWEIYNISTLARNQAGGQTIAVANQKMVDFDIEMAKNYRNYNFNGVVEIRMPNSPFYIDLASPNWTVLDPYIASGETSTGNNTYIHLNNTGYTVVANFIQQKLRSIGI